MHWQPLPIALYPDSTRYIFSGSAVVDWKNTSGFGENSKPPLVAMYTIHDMVLEKKGAKNVESQGIAYSNDNGQTWKKWAKNPVIPNPRAVRDFRDPKVIWDDARSQWIAALAVGDHDELWVSADFKTWSKLQEFGQTLGVHPKNGVWECPDFFPMTVEGSDEKKWVWLCSLNPSAPNGGSGTQYFVGDFDPDKGGTSAKTFQIDPIFEQNVQKGKAVWLDWGRDNYAAVTWSDVPKTDGRRIMIGWMSNWEYALKVPTTVWRSAMTLPRELVLRKTAAGFRLVSKPLKELEKLRGEAVSFSKMEVAASLDLSSKLVFSPTVSELELEFEIPEKSGGATFGIELSNSKNERYRIGFDGSKNEFFSDRTRAGDASFSKTFASKSLAPRFSAGKTIKMHLFFDAASCELFADDGEVAMTEIFFPTEDFSKMSLFSEGGKAVLMSGKVWRLKSIW